MYRDGIADVGNIFQSSQFAAMAASQNIDGSKVRDMALRCMIDLFFNYDQYLIINDQFDTNDLYTSSAANKIGLNAVFRIDDFIESKPQAYRIFLKSLSETQSFAYMMNERTYPGQNDLSFVFFDHCSAMLRHEMKTHNQGEGGSTSLTDQKYPHYRSETLRNQVFNITSDYNRRSSITIQHLSPEKNNNTKVIQSISQILTGVSDYNTNEDDVATNVMIWCREQMKGHLLHKHTHLSMD